VKDCPQSRRNVGSDSIGKSSGIRTTPCPLAAIAVDKNSGSARDANVTLHRLLLISLVSAKQRMT
ncbi:MAG: hypothetical protein WBW88_15860, partial [Rhodothermales bacterium]